MMEWQIALYNNVTYSFAVMLLTTTVISSTNRRYVGAYALIVAVGLLLTFLASVPNWIMPVNTVLLTLYFAKPTKEILNSTHGLQRRLRRTFYYCLTVSTLTWCFIATLSALIMLISPNWFNTANYNLFMGVALMAAALTAKLSKDSMKWCRELIDDGHAIALELVVLVFFSFILPRYYPVIREDDARQWGIFILAFMAVLVIVILLVKRMNDLEYERRSLAMQMERQKSYAGQIQLQYERMVTLRHYYSKLYHSLSSFIRNFDMEGLKVFFEKNISPIHKSHVEAVQISNVKNELIRNFLEVTAEQAVTIGNVILDMDLSGDIQLPDNLIMDVFEILSNLIDNAFREITGQVMGLLRIRLYESFGQIYIQVANTLSCDVDINNIYNREHSNCDNGYGLRRVREIIYSHPNIEHLTYKKGMFEGKVILVQQIIIK